MYLEWRVEGGELKRVVSSHQPWMVRWQMAFPSSSALPPLAHHSIPSLALPTESKVSPRLHDTKNISTHHLEPSCLTHLSHAYPSTLTFDCKNTLLTAI